MTAEDVEEYIREQMEQPIEIDAEDLSPPVCTWCGDELLADDNVVVWDTPEHGNKSVVYRYRYCSEDCMKADKNAVIEGAEMHPHGDPERLTLDERKAVE